MRRPSGTRPRPLQATWCAARPVTSSPAMRTEPWRGASRPMMDFTVVDLPMPLRPISVTTSRSRTSKLMPNSAWLAP
ncbi:hypothetical protein D3C71_2051190 [compost metagenome]